MRIRTTTVSDVHGKDLIDAGFSRQSSHFVIEDSNLKEAIDILKRKIDLIAFGIVAREMGIKYSLPNWIPVQKVVFPIVDMWDGNPGSAFPNVNIRTLRSVNYGSLLDVISGSKTVVILESTTAGNISFGTGIETCNVEGWTVAPNIVVSPARRFDTVSSIDKLVDAMRTSTEMEGRIWLSEIDASKASALASQLESVRRNAADVSKRMSDEARKVFNERMNTAMDALRKYTARRREHQQLSSIKVAPDVVKSHVEGMRSVHGTDGVIIQGEYIHVRFKPFKMSLIYCSNHVQKVNVQVIRTTANCPSARSAYCRGKRIDFCEDGHPMRIGESCQTCGKQFRGVGFTCEQCKKTYKSFGDDVVELNAECTNCGSTRRVEDFEFPAYMGSIKLTKAEDRSVTIKACTQNPHVEANHPHIQSGGHCCFGSAAGTPSYFIREGRYKELVTLLVTLLHSYTPNDAYAGINYWRSQ